MGLSVTAYRQITKAQGSEAFDETGELRWEDGWRQFFPVPDFPGRADEIEHGHAYRAVEAVGGVSVSYSGHMRFRDQLAELVGYEAIEDARGIAHAAASVWANPEPGPFVELINFSDCEGVIGAGVSAKLAKDFADWQHRADEHPDPWFRELYSQWRRTFEVASDGGAVDFH